MVEIIEHNSDPLSLRKKPTPIVLQAPLKYRAEVFPFVFFWAAAQRDPWDLGGDEAVKAAFIVALGVFYDKEGAREASDLLHKTVRPMFSGLLCIHDIFRFFNILLMAGAAPSVPPQYRFLMRFLTPSMNTKNLTKLAKHLPKTSSRAISSSMGKRSLSTTRYRLCFLILLT